MENRDSDELNALTSQVVDYYKRYSQNPNFSSYLRGDVPTSNENLDTCVEPLEVNVSATYGERRPPLIGCDNNENDINVTNVPDDQICNPSPTSSITSTRKLEWDNLADIGYGNCQKQKHLHKSLSLPVLTALEKIKLGDHKLRLSPEGNVADNATQTQRVVKSSSPESLSTSSYKKVSSVSTNSTSSLKDSPQVIDTTSSFSSFSKAKTATTETDFTDIESTAINSDISKVFQSCIGLPMAESTPFSVNIYGNDNNFIPNKQDNSNKEEESSQSGSQKKTVITTLNLPENNTDNETVKHEGTSSEIDEVHELKCVAKCVRSNIKHLSLTKPLSVECTNYKEISDKVIQTSASKIVETASVSVQTEQYIAASEEHIEENKIYPVYEEKRIVEYVIHGNSPEEPRLRSLGTNTDSDMVVSQCNSFEYIFEGNIKSSSSKSPTSTSSNLSRDQHTSSENKLRRVRGKSNLALPTSENECTLSSNVTDFSSKSSPLAELITTKLSKHMIGDVEKSINMLQKLLKSKKYDKVTKQYYVKKIVQKIMHYDYSSETSVNSELPTQSSDDNQDRSEKDGVKIMVESSEESILEQPVQERRLPTSSENKTPNLKKKTHLEIKTFSTEILPEQVAQEMHTKANVEHQQPYKLKDARFTITNNLKDYKNSDETSQIGDTNPDNTPSPRSSPQSAVETSNSSNKSKSFRNWKDELTLSEKRLEQINTTLHCGDGSSNESELLLSFAKKERENQISWINNEISHLNKLKDMLQKKSDEKRINTEKLTQPQVEEMIQKNKTTSVYVITTERSGRSSNSSDTNSISVKSAPERSLNKKCKCLLRRGEKQWCDSSNCPYLKYRSGRSLNKQSFDKMLKKDLEMLPHLTSSKDYQSDTDIENAKLIASEIYKGNTSDCYVQRYVFEMPVRDENITDEGYRKILYKNCNINADMKNAKLIGSEIVKGILPNTHIRRYVFEVPICADESSKVICTTPRKKSNSSRESILLSSEKKCKCKNIPVGRTCKCADVKICECEKNKDTKVKSHLVEQHQVTINPTGTGDSVSDVILGSHRGSKPKTYEGNALNGKMQPVFDPVITNKSSRKVSVSEDTKGVQIITDKITHTNRQEDNIQHPGNQVGHDGITDGNILLSSNRHGWEPQSSGAQIHTSLSPGSHRDRPESDGTHGYNLQSHDVYGSSPPSLNIKVSDTHSHGSRGYEPQSNGVDSYGPQSQGNQSYRPQSYGSQDYRPQSPGSHRGILQSDGTHGNDLQSQGLQGYYPQSHGSQSYRPQLHGTHGNDPQLHGTHGNGPQLHGTHGNGPQLHSAHGNGPQLHGTHGNGPQLHGTHGKGSHSQDIPGYESQSHGRQSYGPQLPGSRRDMPQADGMQDNVPQSQNIRGYDTQSHGIQGHDSQSHDSQSHRPQSPSNHRDWPQLYDTHNDPRSDGIQGYDSQSHGSQNYRPQSPNSHRDRPELQGNYGNDPQSQSIQSHGNQNYRPKLPGDHRDKPQLHSTHGNNPQLQVIQEYDSQSHDKQNYMSHSPGSYKDTAQLHGTHQTQDIQGYNSQSHGGQSYTPQSLDSYRDGAQLHGTHGNDPQSQGTHGNDPQSQGTHGNDPQSQGIQGYDSQSPGGQSYRPQSPNNHRDRPQLHGTNGNNPQSQVIQGYDSQSHGGQSYRSQSPGNHRDRPQLNESYDYDPQSQDTKGYDSQSRSNQIYRPQSPSHGYRPSVGETIISEYQGADILTVSPSKIIDEGTGTANTNGSRPETGDFQQTLATHPVVYIPDSNDSRKRSLQKQYIFKRTPQTEITKITYHTANKLYDEIINYEDEPSVNTVAPTKTNKQSQYEHPEGNDATTSGTERSPTKNKTSKHKTKHKASESSSSSYSSSSSGSYDSDSDPSGEVPRLCLCCNKAETKYRSVLRGLPGKLRDALCEPCYTNNIQHTNWPHSKQYYTHPGHVCSCYTVLKTETIRNIQRTVNELENLEREREICSCTRECRVRKHGGKGGKQRKSIAYMLTFEDVEKTASEEDDKGKKHRLKPLEEVRVKVPHLVKKSHKDKENRKKHKRDRHGKHRRKHHSSKPLTLQDYLCVHRPNFVANAEERRKALIELSYLREERCQKYKQLLAMSNGVFPETNIDNKASRLRMFTSQEMKQITAKNYKKLPEVQSKLEANRNKQIKKANKILADIFNKKLRDNVLKGRLTLSTNTSVIKLP